jgi:putative ATP-binding cassette transporter
VAIHPGLPAIGALRSLAALGRLATPFLLRPGRRSPAIGPSALLLLPALLLQVAAVALLLLSAAAALVLTLAPGSLDRLLPALPHLLQATWRPPAGLPLPAPGPLLLLAAGGGALAFAQQRRRLAEGRWRPWLLLAVILLLIVLINAINVVISFLVRDVDNSLVAYDTAGFRRSLALYALCLVLALPVRAVQRWAIPRLALFWRAWLSRDLLHRWLKGRAFYRLDPVGDDDPAAIDNPDQRISQDADEVTGTSLSLSVEALEAVITCAGFAAVLWSINARLALVLLGYATVATTLIAVAARRLERLNRDQLRLEADFRYGLVHIRNNSEAIAFYRGEAQEAREGQRRLGAAIGNADRLILWETLVSVVQTSYGAFSDFLPWLVLAPLFFAHRVEFGVFGQAGLAYAQVLTSLSYVVDNIDRLAAIAASIRRLDDFQARLTAITGLPSPGSVATSAVLRVRHADLRPPGSDRLLIRDLSLVIEPGVRLLVVGPSGCGKTSLLRLLSGLWPPSAGVVERPPPGEMMFVPQKPYLPLGSLRQQLSYPRPAEPGCDGFSDTDLRRALEAVQLPELLHRYPNVDVRHDWPRVLSPGEQQRLAFARILLHAPRFVVLDEATSALDLATEEALYGALVQTPAALVSVAHRSTLRRFHGHVLELDGSGGWHLS